MLRLLSIGMSGVVLLLASCASHIPDGIKSAIPDSPDLTAVQQDIDAHIGRQVRWGGVIVSVENKQNHTWIELMDLELYGYGKPRDADSSQGRFFAKIEGFLDPTIYAKDRKFTVVGTLDGKHSGTIGEHPYTYPVIATTENHLWAKSNQADGAYNDYPYYGYGYGYGHRYGHYGFGYRSSYYSHGGGHGRHHGSSHHGSSGKRSSGRHR